MLTFFRHLGLGIISAFTAFSGAFHSSPATTTTPAMNTVATSSVAITSRSNEANNSNVKAASVAMQPAITVAVPLANSASQTDYSAYGPWPNDFVKNPPYYVGQKVRISGRVVDFLAAGDRGGLSNYIEIAPSSTDVSSIALLISSSNYQETTQDVNVGDNVVVYGVIQASQTFLNANRYTSQTIPVLSVLRLDLCNSLCQLAVGSQTVFPQTSGTPISLRGDLTSLSRVFQNPDLFMDTKIKTSGKVIRILNSDTSATSMIFIQDPSDGRGLAFFTVPTGYVTSNHISIGSEIIIAGTILPSNNSESIAATRDFHSIDINGFFYIINGTVSLEN